MNPFLGRVGLDVAGGQNRIALEFAADPSRGFPPYFNGVPRGRAAWLEAADGVRQASRDEDGDGWRSVIDEIASRSARAGTGGAVIEKMKAAARREAFFVVTGQQPGAFGGPLLTLYKAWTAVAAASALEDITGLPFIPLYWCGSDDTDFQEIRGCSLVTRDLVPISTSIAQQAHRAGLPTGDIALEWLERAWKNIRGFADEFSDGAFVVEAVEGALATARDHGEHAAAVLVGLTGGALAVVDGRSAAIRRHARPVFFEYARDEDRIKTTIEEEGRRLEAGGYHAQLAVTEDSGIFLLEDGIRKNVTPELRSRLLGAVRTEVERCSPGVIARNLVQDFVLKPVAVVLGPAEIAYRAQISAVYGRLKIPQPALLPRLAATFLPPPAAELLEEERNGEVAGMIGDPEAFVRAVFERSIPGSVREAARELEAAVGQAADDFERTVGAAATAKAAARVRARAAELRGRARLAAESVSEIGRALASERLPFLAHLASLIRPAGKPQERTLSAVVPYLFAGAGAIELVGGAAGAHVDDLLDGRTNHIIYSSAT